MSASATRYAHRSFNKASGHVSTAALGLTRNDLTPEVADPLAPTLALSRPDLAGRKPIAYVGGTFFYDECNVVCRVPMGPKKVRYERWVMANV